MIRHRAILVMGFWYASNATIQVFLFGRLVISIKVIVTIQVFLFGVLAISRNDIAAKYRKWPLDRCAYGAGGRGEGRRVGSKTTERGRANPAATIRVCAFGRCSVAILVVVLMGVLAVVAVGVSMVYE